LALALLLALGAAESVRAEGTVRSEVDQRRVGVRDQVQLTVTVESSSLPDQVPPPLLVDLRVAGGPSVSTQMSFINGRTSQSRSWTWMLQPIAVGHAQVGAVQVTLGGTTTGAPAIPIEVVAGSVAPPRQAQRSIDPFGSNPFEDMFGRTRPRETRVLVQAKPSRTHLFVGEPLLLTYYLYTQASVSGLQFAEVPQFAGFWAEDLTLERQQGGEPATVDGVEYRRFPVFSKLLFPTRAGRITLPAATLRVGVAAQTFFDQGFEVTRTTEPVTVEVKPIPETPGFSGAVGRFTASAAIDHPEVALGEAATLRFKVEGRGNLKWVDRGPELSVSGAKVYPPQVKSDLHTGPSGISGSRTWEFVVVPQTVGTLEIPALAFSYFDPATERIVEAKTTPIPLRVGGAGAAGAAGAAIPPQAAAPGGARGGPLRLRTELGSTATRPDVPGTVVGFVAVAALLLHGLLWGGGRLAATLARPGARPAPRSARGAMRDLARVGREPMSKEAAALLIEKTLHAAFGSLDGGDGERARAVRALLEDVHAVRYAPQLGDYSERLRELATRTAELVRKWA
jgi:hypothetical protein